MMEVIQKICKTCGKSKPLEDFSPKKSGKYGRRATCKGCRRVPHLKEHRDAQKLCLQRAEQGEAVKFCFRCQTCKPIEEFSNSSKNVDGKRSECKQCRSEYYFNNHEQATERIQKYYKENQEKITSHRREYYVENQEHERQRNQEYYQVNRDLITKQKAQYRRENPEIKKVSDQRRLARQQNLPDTFTREDWQQAVDYFGGKCAVCGREPNHEITLAADHWIPLASADCPGTVPKNIIPLCHGIGGCNNEKQHFPPEKWLVRKFGNEKAQEKLIEIQSYFDYVAP